mmetsp:Transcript_15435/g.38898  ORF Transcript_15435/g.38898 Transcript_15435/m.38898 type:complete len:250 (-) Transcript_15435:335-1084(-)
MDALIDSELGSTNITQVTHGERHSWVLLVDLSQNLARSLDLQEVLLFDITLENSCSHDARSCLPVSSGHGDINRINFGLFEFAVGDLFFLRILRSRFFEGDLFDTIQDISLHLVHSNGRDWSDAIGLGDTVDCLCDISVGLSGSNTGGSYQHGVVRSNGTFGELGILRWGRAVGGFLNHDSVSSNSDVSIKVASQIEFDDVPAFERWRGFWVGIIERTAVADYVIDANANGKCNTTIDRFSVHFFGVKL